MQLKIIYSKREDKIMSNDEIFNPTLTKKKEKISLKKTRKNF